MSITRARWCGKVIFDMLSFRSALALTVSLMPQEPPMRKQIFGLPEFPRSVKSAEKSSLLFSFPSTHSAATKASFGIALRISAPSFSSAAAISAAEGLSGRRCSPISTSSNLQ